MKASKTGCTGPFPQAKPQAHLKRFVILPKLPAIPAQVINHNHSMATTTASSPNKETKAKAAPRNSSWMER